MDYKQAFEGVRRDLAETIEKLEDEIGVYEEAIAAHLGTIHPEYIADRSIRMQMARCALDEIKKCAKFADEVAGWVNE